MDSTATNYRGIANSDDGTCLYAGCLQAGMLNYDSSADLPGECTPYIDGCMTVGAENFVPWANRHDGSCKFVGCTDLTRDNYNPSATEDDGTCTPVFYGCCNPEGENFKVDYTMDDGSCTYGGCTDSAFEVYDLKASFDDLTCAPYQVRRSLSGTCRDPSASNYEAAAVCEYLILGCTNVNAINYLDVAEQDKGDCVLPVYGCTISKDTLNFDSTANMLQDCVYIAKGCTDSTATNYKSDANTEDQTCLYYVFGCTSQDALNWDSTADVLLEGSCIFEVNGCLDSTAHNFASDANTACKSCCEYITRGCMSADANNYDSIASLDDGSCIVLSPPPSPPPPSVPPESPPPPGVPPTSPPPPSTPPPPSEPALELSLASSPVSPSQLSPPTEVAPFMTVVTLTASGTVDDYTPDVRSSIIRSFAMGAQVAESDVTLEVTAASVILLVSIASPTRAAAQSVQNTLTPMLSSTDDAALFMPPGLTVETVPEIEVTETGSSSSADDDALPLGPIAGAAAAALVFAACTIAVYCALRGKTKKPNLGPRGVPSHRLPDSREKAKVETRSPMSSLSTPRSAACAPGSLSTNHGPTWASARLGELGSPAYRQELAQQRSLQSDRIDERMDSRHEAGQSDAGSATNDSASELAERAKKQAERLQRLRDASRLNAALDALRNLANTEVVEDRNMYSVQV